LCLGDPQACEIFVKKFNELTVLGDKKEDDCMSYAFDTVIKNETIKSVDHFKVVVKSHVDEVEKTRFEYSPSINSKLTKPIIVKIKKTGVPVIIPANVATKDIRGTSMFTSCHTRMFGFAVYDLEKESGVLFCPQLKLGVETFKIVTGKTIETAYQNFIDEIYKKYQLPLDGLIWLPGTMGIKRINNIPDHLKK